MATLVFAMAVLLPRAAIAQIVLEETVTGGHKNTSPVLLPDIQAGTDQTYVLIIVTNNHKDVTAVTGGGLQWTERVEQCGLVGRHGIRLWTAQGSQSSSFQTQIDYEGVHPLAAVLMRYSGARSIVDATGANLLGENDESCAAGQSTLAQLALSSLTDGSVHVIGVAPGDETIIATSPGYNQAGSALYGNGGLKTRAFAFEQEFALATSDVFEATLNGNYWWTTAGVVLSTAEPINPVFEEVSSSIGFDFQTSTKDNKPSGLHFADFDNDGDLDAVVTGDDQSRQFTSIDEGAAFASTLFGDGKESGAAALIDIDNDNDIDVWMSGESLYMNNGSGQFTDEGDLGFWSPSSTSGTAAADLNNDGYADLLMFSASGNWIGHHEAAVEPLLAQTDDPSFGFSDSGSVGNGAFCASGDVNNDGHLDYYYHYNGGRLFVSEADGTFVQNAMGIAVATAQNEPVGPTFGDYDNDGDLDLFVPRYSSGSPGYLWRNDGNSFTNVAMAAGVSDTSGQRSSTFGDYDNDGDLDLYICTSESTNVLYENQGDGTFVAVSIGANINGTSQDAVFVDYDNDGDLDLAMTQEGSTNVFLKNTTNTDTYLKVRVLGHGAAMTNNAAIGVRVELFQADGTTFLARREIGVASGFGGTEPLWVHFGGVDPNETYVVKATAAGRTLSASVVPNNVSTTIGSTTISQMLTLEESSPRIVGWREIDPR